jgi:hypothetical protein
MAPELLLVLVPTYRAIPKSPTFIVCPCPMKMLLQSNNLSRKKNKLGTGSEENFKIR